MTPYLANLGLGFPNLMYWSVHCCISADSLLPIHNEAKNFLQQSFGVLLDFMTFAIRIPGLCRIVTILICFEAAKSDDTKLKTHTNL